jgi:hypothetical protein
MVRQVFKGMVLVAGVMAVSFALAADDIVDYSDWGLRNGCISNMNIKRVRFESRDTGVIELSGGKKLKITLRNGCSGIRTEGYVHKPINHRFCEGDILRVLNYGNSCIVEKLEPLTEEEDDSHVSSSVDGSAG